MGKFTDAFNKKLEITDKSEWHRELYQSYMTTPEWRNVEMAEEYAQFIKDGNSIFSFPYFKQIWGLWGIFFNSYAAARKYHGFWEVINSEYMVMDLFVVLFTTFELLPKGLLSLFLSPFLSKANSTEMQGHIAEFQQKYAADLQTIPFYNHDYAGIHANLAQKYKACQARTWGDWFTWKCLSIELHFRKWISKPLQQTFNNDSGGVPGTTEILVKYNVQDCSSPNQAVESLKAELASLSENNLPVRLVNNQIYAKDKNPNKSYISVYARLQVPRYAAFKEVLSGLSEKQIHIRKIAGQDRVQVKCEINAQDQPSLTQAQHQLNEKLNLEPLYFYSDSLHSNRRICLFDLPVRDLAEKTSEVSKVNDTKVSLIHNF